MPADLDERLRPPAGGVAEPLGLAAAEDDRLHLDARGRARTSRGRRARSAGRCPRRRSRPRARPPGRAGCGRRRSAGSPSPRASPRARGPSARPTRSRSPPRPRPRPPRAPRRRSRRPPAASPPSATGSQPRTSAPSASRRPASTIDGASRMSSVFGLNASPSSATFLPAERAEVPLELRDHAPLLQLVHLDHRRQELEVVARVRRELLQRERVLREARAAVADPGAQEVRAEPAVEPDALRDLDDVGAGRLADVRDLVDERDPRHQERVRGELDHLGRVDVAADDRRVERLVERRDARRRPPPRRRRRRSGRDA